MTPYDTDLIIKIIIATLIGGVIGYERQRYRKPAGIRTQVLICVGSALQAGISIDIAQMYAQPGAAAQPDPARLMAQIIPGIAFLGGGVILKGDDRISGVTTAATIWIAAALGIAVGAGFYAVAAFCAGIVLLTHPLAKIKHKTVRRNIGYTLIVPKEKWNDAVATIEDMRAEYRIQSITTVHSSLRVYSTDKIKNELVKQLHQRKIGFELQEIR